ncbi:unnamed protein product [Ectocarpus sp. 8 AP-2014]
MNTLWVVIAVTCFLSTARTSSCFTHGARFRPPRLPGSCSSPPRATAPLESRARATAPAAAAGVGGEEEGDVLLAFKPSEVEVTCKPGEVALDVASRCSGMPEDSKAPFCRDGGCYNCEVEVVEAAELGIVDNLVRACQFKIPAEAKQLTLVQMTSEAAFEDML